jgi:hypothetical protein
MLKLIHSERSLRETKAMMKVATVALTTEYAKLGDLKDLQNLEGCLYRIRQARQQTQGLLKVKFAPRKMNSTRAEHLAKRALGYGGSISSGLWKRDGNLVRKGRANKPRIGSSAGKIGKTRIVGAKNVLKDFRRLTKTLQDLMRKYGKGDTKALQKNL